MKRIMRFTALAFLAAAALSACAAPQATATPQGDSPPEAEAVIAEGRLKPSRAVALAFLAPGAVQEISVKLGDRVKAGDVLARMVQAGQAEAQVVEAQQAYDLLLRDANGGRARAWRAYMDAQKAREAAQEDWHDINLRDIENRIEDRQEDLQDRQADLKKAQDRFEKYEDRGKDDANYKDAEDDLEHAQSDYDDALKDLEATMRERDVPRASLDAALALEAETKHQYDLSLDGPNTDQLALVRAQLAAAKGALANYVINAPFDGVVADVSIEVGEQAGPSTAAVSIADFSQWVVETTDVSELEVVKLAEGQKVRLVPDALPDLTMTGRITEISRAFKQQGGDILYTVRIAVDQPDPRLRWGMTVEATFEPLEK
jgi:multidrug efflux pump subunit AcrA (membrane-fusion protein)